MRRVSKFTTLALSDSEAEVKECANLFHVEDERADILRSLVVFLHATFDELVRSQSLQRPKSWTFNSASDLNKISGPWKTDPNQFRDLYPPLTQLTRRRCLIVHHADLKKPKFEVLQSWTIADHWSLIMWQLTVLASYFRLLKALGVSNVVEDSFSQKITAAMAKHTRFGRALLAFPGLPPEQRSGGLKNIHSILIDVLDVLDSSKLEAEIIAKMRASSSNLNL
jgi:hypothetical protein